MELEYIKANGKYYYPQEAGIRNDGCDMGNYPVCKIKKLLFGRWQVDYFDERAVFDRGGYYSFGDEDKPNQRIIVYPAGIEEIRWYIKKKD